MNQEIRLFGAIAVRPAVLAVKEGSRPLNIGSVEAFEHALKSARSIAYAADGTSGGYFLGLLERLGIAGEVKPKLVAVPGGQTALVVARGEAELGVVPVTSILAAAPEAMLVGRFPAELQSYVDFDIGISADSRDTKAVKQLSEFLMSNAVDDILAAKGRALLTALMSEGLTVIISIIEGASRWPRW